MPMITLQFRLDGQIVKQIGKKDFLFKDASGKEIQIEVSKKHGMVKR